MKVLLIWEQVPEDTTLYLIEDPTEEQLAFLSQANGWFINLDDENEGMLFLNDAICKEEYREDCSNQEWACIWANKEVATPVEGPIDKVFLSGFIL